MALGVPILKHFRVFYIFFIFLPPFSIGSTLKKEEFAPPGANSFFEE